MYGSTGFLSSAFHNLNKSLTQKLMHNILSINRAYRLERVSKVFEISFKLSSRVFSNRKPNVVKLFQHVFAIFHFEWFAYICELHVHCVLAIRRGGFRSPTDLCLLFDIFGVNEGFSKGRPTRFCLSKNAKLVVPITLPTDMSALKSDS